MNPVRRAAVLAGLILAVASLLTLCDWLCHVRQDVLFYADPDKASLLAGQPTAEVFAGFLGLATIFVLVGAWLFRRDRSPGRGRAITLVAVFVGEVENATVNDGDPILYFRGDYRSISA